MTYNWSDWSCLIGHVNLLVSHFLGCAECITVEPLLLHTLFVHNTQEERFVGGANFKYLIWKVV